MIKIPICPKCGGNGLQTCLACGGTGMQEEKRCQNCGGVGFAGPCPTCDGRGKISWDEALVLEEP